MDKKTPRRHLANKQQPCSMALTTPALSRALEIEIGAPEDPVLGASWNGIPLRGGGISGNTNYANVRTKIEQQC